MAVQRHTIRLFVSSTFSDLKAERDTLQREVFPRLKQLCLSKGLRFQAIDLRWGISDEAGRDNKTMRICLRELKRCQKDRPKPNFLILLGDRYGWRPLPEIIPADVFEELEKRLATDCTDNTEILKKWYRRDDNAVPPVYELQPREGRFEYFEVWYNEVELPLLAVLDRVAKSFCSNSALSAPLREILSVIGSSATEQEIIEGALKVADAATHVRAFFRTIDGLPDPGPKEFVETGEAAYRIKELKERIRKHIGDDNTWKYHVPWHGDGIQPDDLKDFCDKSWKQLSAVVEQQIASLTKTPPEEQEEQAHQDFAMERCRHFVGRKESLDHIADYLNKGTGLPLAVIGPSGSGKSALMAKAVSQRTEGGGQRTELQKECHNLEIIARFIGATPASSNLIQLLRNIVCEIRKRYPMHEGMAALDERAAVSGKDVQPKPSDAEIPYEFNPLVNAFHDTLTRPKADKPLFLFLDALDQLTASNNAHSLSWLPSKLSEHVRLVVSAASPAAEGRDDSLVLSNVEGPRRQNSSDEAARPAVTPYQEYDPRSTIIAALTSRLNTAYHVMLSPLTFTDGEQMLSNWLADADRTLQPLQRDRVLAVFSHEGSPLWLRAATEEAARLASWEPAPAFESTTQKLLGQVLDRLSREEEHGKTLVSRTLGYLACARHGLAEDEILDILSADKEVMTDFVRRSPNSPEVDSLPVAVWVRLHGDLSFYFAEHHAQGASLLVFYHRQMGEAVDALYLAHDEKLRYHRALATWFTKKPTWAGQPEYPIANLRKVAELTYQLASAQCWNSLDSTLRELNFMEAKCAAAQSLDILTDLQAAARGLSQVNIESARAYTAAIPFFRAHIAHLQSFPESFLSIVHLAMWQTAEAPNSPVKDLLSCWIAQKTTPWLRTIYLPQNPGSQILEFRLQAPPDFKITRLLSAQAGTLLMAIGDSGKKLVWNLTNPGPIELTGSGTNENEFYLASHKDPVRFDCGRTVHQMEMEWPFYISSAQHPCCPFKVEVLTRSERISPNRCLALIDKSSGQSLITWRPHGAAISDILFLHDSMRFATASDEGEVAIWNASLLDPEYTIGADLASTVSSGHGNRIKGIDLDHTGTRCVSLGYGCDIFVWDMVKKCGVKLGQIGELYNTVPRCVHFVRNSQIAIASGSLDSNESIHLIDTNTGTTFDRRLDFQCSSSLKLIESGDGPKACDFQIVALANEAAIQVWRTTSPPFWTTSTTLTQDMKEMTVTVHPGFRYIPENSLYGIHGAEIEDILCLSHYGSLVLRIDTVLRMVIVKSIHDLHSDCGNLLVETLPGFEWKVSCLTMKEGTKYRLAGEFPYEGCTWSLDASMVVITDHCGRVAFVSLGDARPEINHTSAHAGEVTACAIRGDGNFAVTVGADKTLVLWDCHQAKILARLPLDFSPSCCALSANGRTIAVGMRGGQVLFLSPAGIPAYALPSESELRKKEEDLLTQLRARSVNGIRALSDLSLLERVANDRNNRILSEAATDRIVQLVSMHWYNGEDLGRAVQFVREVVRKHPIPEKRIYAVRALPDIALLTEFSKSTDSIVAKAALVKLEQLKGILWYFIEGCMEPDDLMQLVKALNESCTHDVSVYTNQDEESVNGKYLLQMMRTVPFASRVGFMIDPHDAEACKTALASISCLCPVERTLPGIA